MPSIPSGHFKKAQAAAERVSSETRQRTGLDSSFLGTGLGCQNEVIANIEGIHVNLNDQLKKLTPIHDKAKELGLKGIASALTRAAADAGKQAGAHFVEQGLGLAQEALASAVSEGTEMVKRRAVLALTVYSMMQNLGDTLAAASMSLVLLRLRISLKELEGTMREIDESFVNIVEGANVVSEALSLFGGSPEVTRGDVAPYVRDAERRTILAQTQLKETQGLRGETLTGAAQNVQDAIRLLGGGEATLGKLLGKDLAQDLMRRPASFFAGANPWGEIREAMGQRWGRVQRGVTSAKKLQSLIKLASDQYETSMGWVKMARLLPYTVDFNMHKGVVRMTEQELITIRDGLGRVAVGLEESEEVSSTLRAKSLTELTLLKGRLEALSVASIQSREAAENSWYVGVQDLLLHEFWEQDTFQKLQDIETWSLVVSGKVESEADVKDAVPAATRGRLFIPEIMGRMGDAISLLDDSALESTSVVGGAWYEVEGILRRLGAADPLKLFVSGEMPGWLDAVILGTTEGLTTIRATRDGMGMSNCARLISAPLQFRDRPEILLRDAARELAILSFEPFDAIAEAERVRVIAGTGMSDTLSEIK